MTARRSKLIAWGQSVSVRAPRPPGNSCAAIDFAYSAGFDGVEMDIGLTKDRVPILMHDQTIDATTKGSGRTADFTFNELQGFSLGTWKGAEVRIPSLSEALRANAGRGSFLCDMRLSADYAPVIAEAIAGANPGIVRISAYEIDVAVRYKSLMPSADVILKRYEFPGDIDMSLLDVISRSGLGGVMIQMPHGAADIGDLLSAAHALGLSVTTFVQYNKGSVEQLQSFVDVGVDHILTQNSHFLPQIRR